MMNDPLTALDADNTRLLWIGYPNVAAPDRFVIPDRKTGLIYVYVPLELACRWLTTDNQDGRRMELRFHPTDLDDTRLAEVRERYRRRAKLSLDYWDHTPKNATAPSV